jgi:acyl-CoA synthetase (AMP-forming)/AMP-acid ligase II
VTSRWELVEWRAAATPDHEMLVDERGRRVTFGEFTVLATKAAAGLAGRGVTASTAVTWQLPTTVETLALAAALAKIRAVQNPVIPGYGERNLEFVVRQTNARLLITTERWTSHALGEQARAVAGRVPGLDVLLIDALGKPDEADGETDQAGEATDEPGADGRPPVRWVFCTSGTTAEPKGARHTDASVLASSAGMARALALTEDDRVGLVFPVAHIGGCGTWLGACLMSGCTLILDVAFDLATTTGLQQREHVTVAGSGTVFTQLYLGLQRKQPGHRLFPHARMLTAGAAPRPPQLHAEVKEEMGGIGVLSGYGMTEAPILTMAATTDPDAKLASTEGLPCPGVEFRVVDGELRVKAPRSWRATWTRRSTRTPSTPTATCGPASRPAPSSSRGTRPRPRTSTTSRGTSRSAVWPPSSGPKEWKSSQSCRAPAPGKYSRKRSAPA